MADELTLFMSKADFDDIIGQIDGKLHELEAIADEYDGLRDNVSSFMDQDDRVDEMKRAVQENVRNVHMAIGQANLTKKNLQDTVDEMEQFSSNVGKTIEQAAQTAKSGAEAVFNAAELGII